MTVTEPNITKLTPARRVFLKRFYKLNKPHVKNFNTEFHENVTNGLSLLPVNKYKNAIA